MEDANKRKPDGETEGAAAPERKRRRWDTAGPAAAVPAAAAPSAPAAVREASARTNFFHCELLLR